MPDLTKTRQRQRSAGFLLSEGCVLLSNDERAVAEIKKLHGNYEGRDFIQIVAYPAICLFAES
jgi:hypothetical protein